MRPWTFGDGSAHRVAISWPPEARTLSSWQRDRWRLTRSSHAVSVAVLTVLVLAIVASPARAQVTAVPAPSLTTTAAEGPFALSSKGTLYVGGWWRFGPRSGHTIAFDDSGAVQAPWPEIDGPVLAVVGDGAGGWFIAGDFSFVGDQPRSNLAHIRASGALDATWAPGAVDGPVLALVVVGGTVYAGGDFTSIGGQPRARLAALDSVSGRLRPWNPKVDGEVYTLAAAGGVIHAGGDFARGNGTSRPGLAAFDAVTGALTPWNPGLSAAPDPATVYALVIAGGTLYVGGHYSVAGGRQRQGLASFEIATGALTSWAPTPDHDGGVLAVAGDTVYLVGQSGGTGIARRSVTAVDARTGQALPWRADIEGFDSGHVNALAVVGDRLYVGGEFDSIAGQSRTNLAALSLATGAPLPWDPRPNGWVGSIASSGSQVVVGGGFVGVGSESQDSLGAIDLNSGVPTLFTGRFRGVGGDGVDANALATQGDTILAAGSCNYRGCHRTRYLARFDARTGEMRTWKSLTGVTGDYNALAAHGHTLFVGGYFRTIGGRKRSSLAAIDIRTGRVLRWRMDTNHAVFDLVIAGRTLYLTGGFTRVAGRRRYGVAAIDLRSGRLTAWAPKLDFRPDAMAVTARRVYFGGFFRRVDGRRRPYLAAVSRRTGRLERWNPRLNEGVRTLAVIGDTVYAGGQFTSVSGARREHIAALDASSGAPTSWNPGANGEVFSLLATPAGLLAGGEFNWLGGVSVGGGDSTFFGAPPGFGLFPRVTAKGT